MAFVPPKDRVLEHSTSNSQTVFAVTGAIDTSYNAFSASMSIGDTTIGGVVEPGVAFVSGVLTYSATNQVTVTSVFESKGTFSAGGVKEVFMGLPGSRAPLLDRPNSFSDATEATGAGTTAAAIFAGGIEILKKLFVAGIAKFTAGVASTSTTTGSIVVTGGAGISGAANVGGAGTFGGLLSALGLAPTADVASGGTIESPQLYSVASGATKTFVSGSGLIIARDNSIHGGCALFLFSAPASTITLIGQTAAGPFVVSGSPGASQWGATFTGTQFQFKNGSGSTQSIWVHFIRTG